MNRILDFSNYISRYKLEPKSHFPFRICFTVFYRRYFELPILLKQFPFALEVRETGISLYVTEFSTVEVR